MNLNKNLKEAKRNKNDEFYTQLKDIENELKYYKHHFKDKVIYCNADDPRISNFFHYFSYNFDHFGLKKLITTCYKNQQMDFFSKNDTDKAIYLEYTGEKDGGKVPTIENIGINNLKSDGDFRSEECIALLKQADIVVTNPPFSLFREYVAQLIEYDKKFIILGNTNALTYKEIFSLIKENKIWLGNTWNTMYFEVPLDKSYKDGWGYKIDEEGRAWRKFRNIRWFTNLDIPQRYEELILYKKYNEEEYPKYENYNAINVDKTAEIPMDYDGIMGVPITFMDKYNPNQFEIVELGIVGSCTFTNNRKMEILKRGKPTGKYTYNAKGTLYRKYNPNKDKKYPAFKDCETGELYSSIYARVLIKNKKVVK